VQRKSAYKPLDFEGLKLSSVRSEGHMSLTPRDSLSGDQVPGNQRQKSSSRKYWDRLVKFNKDAYLPVSIQEVT